MPDFQYRNSILPRAARKVEYKPFKVSEFDATKKPVKIIGISKESGSKYLKVDAAVSQSHEASVEITQHPVEIGADISDFAIVNPRIFEVDGRVSAVKPMKENSTPNSNDILLGSKNRVASAWEALEDAMRKRRLVSIESNLKTYENILIRSISSVQEWRTAHVLDFKMIVQEVILTQVSETKIAEGQIAEGSKAQGGENKDKGEVQGETVESGNEASVLAGIEG